MYKKLFVLFVALVFVSSIAFVIYQNNKEVKREEFVNEQLTQDDGENIEETEEVLSTEEDFLGSLIIEKIGVNATVKEGSTSDILKDYIGHIEETSKYDGNVALAAHNRGVTIPYFARLNELETGDIIKYETKFGQRQYVVNKKQEILETDWSMLGSTKENMLTLITCIKNRVNQRLCVQAVENTNI